MDTSALQAALAKLDISNDNHWTADGQPRLDTVKMLAGNPAINRESVDAAAPGFTRANAAGYDWAAAATQATAQPATQLAAPTPAAVQSEPSGAAGGEQGGDTFSANPPEQSKVGTGADSGEEDEDEALEEELAKAVENTQALRSAMDDLTKKLTEAIKVEDAIRDKLDAKQPANKGQLTIQAYLARQEQIRMERANRRELIRNSGLDLKALAADLKAPIDAARARRK